MSEQHWRNFRSLIPKPEAFSVAFKEFRRKFPGLVKFYNHLSDELLKSTPPVRLKQSRIEKLIREAKPLKTDNAFGLAALLGKPIDYLFDPPSVGAEVKSATYRNEISIANPLDPIMQALSGAWLEIIVSEQEKLRYSIGQFYRSPSHQWSYSGFSYDSGGILRDYWEGSTLVLVDQSLYYSYRQHASFPGFGQIHLGPGQAPCLGGSRRPVCQHWREGCESSAPP